MLAYLWIAIGGALGSVGRYWFSGVVARHFGETFPWGTLLVNVSGSFVIGFFATLTGPDGRWLVPAWFRQQFFMLGVCGGYTTFSSFSLQTLNLARGRRMALRRRQCRSCPSSRAWWPSGWAIVLAASFNALRDEDLSPH